MSKYVFGIDLGTTYSCIAYVDDRGIAQVIKNSDGNTTTPSVVAFDGKTITVGESAKEEAVLKPNETVSLVKSKMGKTDTVIKYNGKNISPEEVSSYILKKIANDASEQLSEPVKDVVITCPAYFGTAERMATKKAGEIAGLNVLEIISEPTAAALDYGCAETHDDKTILVYDLGGGTFDVTIMRITSDRIEVICSDGDHDLGGKNWDALLMRYILKEFEEKNGSVELDASSQQDLRLKVEKLKKQLSSKPQASSMIDINGKRQVMKLNRDEFDSITNTLLSQTLNKTEEVIKVAKNKGYDQIDEILLVGGSTRMPQVKNALSKKYGEDKIKVFDPDEAVAKGAAIHAVNVYVKNQKALEDKTFISSERRNDLNPNDYEEDLKVDERSMSVGGAQREIIMATTKSFAVKVTHEDKTEECVNMIIKNEPMKEGFIEVSDEFYTLFRNQATVNIEIYENDYMDKKFDVDEEFFLGNAILELPKNLPAGSPIQITMKLSGEGILEVTGLDKVENNKVNVKMETKGVMSDEKFEEVKEKVKGMTVL